MSSILKVDTINENSSGGGVTIDGLKIKDVSAGSTMSKPILQIVTGTTTTDTGATATTSYSDTGLSASITPTSTSSKVLVIITQTLQMQRNGDNEMTGYINIMRDTTEVTEYYMMHDEVSGDYGPAVRTLTYLDSPSTTSATTYKTQMKGSTTSDSGSVRANQQSASGESISSIQLIEVAG